MCNCSEHSVHYRLEECPLDELDAEDRERTLTAHRIVGACSACGAGQSQSAEMFRDDELDEAQETLEMLQRQTDDYEEWRRAGFDDDTALALAFLGEPDTDDDEDGDGDDE